MERLRYLKKRFEKFRWPGILGSSKKHNVPLPDKEKLWKVILQNYHDGFECEYCGRKLLIKDFKFPYSRSFSIDHRKSLFLDGDNRISNFAVCCTACNNIKGTATAETYQKVVDAILEKHSRNLLEKWHKQTQIGGLADKIEREKLLEGG